MKIRILIPAVVVVALGGLLVAPSFVSWEQYRAKIQDTIKESTGYSVELRGDIDVAILPSPRVMIEDIVVLSPVKNSSDAIFLLERLDVHVALAPLFKKQVQVNSIRMIQPQLKLKVLAGGVQNWVLPVKPAKLGPDKEQGQGGDTSEAPQISFDDIKVYGGSFSFENVSRGRVTGFDGVDLDIAAGSLYGPYKVKGQGGFQDYELSFDAAADGYDPVAKSIAPHIVVSVSPGDVAFEYSGIVSFADGVDAQGEMSLSMASLAKTLSSLNGGKVNKKLDNVLSIKGFITGSEKGFKYKDLSVKFGKSTFSGDTIGIVSKDEIKVSANLSGDIDVSSALLPASIKTVVEYSLGSGDVKLGSSDFVLDGNSIRLSGMYQKADNDAGRDFLSINASSPKIDWDRLGSQLFSVKTTKVSGDSAPSTERKKNLVDVEAMAKSLRLPFDLDFDVSVAQLMFNKMDLTGVRAKGGLRGDAVVFEVLSVEDILNSSLAVSGGIKDISVLSGLNIRAAVKTSDVRPLMSAFGQDTKKTPVALKGVDVDLSLKGAVDALDVVVNVDALNAKIMAKGKLLSPLDKLSFEGLGVQVKHSNMAKLLSALDLEFTASPILSNPIDIYADISLDGKRYGLSNIKGKMLGTALSGEMDVDLSNKKPDISGDLKLGILVVSSKSSSVDGEKTSSGSIKGSKKSSSVRWSNTALNVDWMNGLNADIGVSLATLKYNKWNLSKPSLRFKLKNGDLDILKLDAGLFGGTINLTAKMHGGASVPVKLDIVSDIKLRDVDLGLLSAALSPNPLVKGTGQVNADVKLASTGGSQARIVKALNGSGEVNGKAIVLEGLDLTRFVRALSSDAKIGDSVLGMWKGSTQGGSTSFDVLSGAFAVKNGVVLFDQMDLDGPKALIETKGQVNLPLWTISTQHSVTLKEGKQIPPVEMSFSGSLDNPGQTFAKGALDDYISRKINRKLEKLLTDKLGIDPFRKVPAAPAPASGNAASTQADPAPQPEQISPEDALRGLLEGLISF